ncbi:MAG: hypothetical protein WBP93_18890 [Pyrinomonadaceae bacterium]
MPTYHLVKRSLTVSLLLFACAFFATVSAQTSDDTSASQQQRPRPTVSLPQERGPAQVAGPSNLLCGGMIPVEVNANAFEIVGGEQEQEQREFTEGDYVYLNAGSQQGLRAGQEFSVIRPRGKFYTKLTAKKGALGVFTQELGQLRVVSVKANISVAVVSSSCDTMMLGDMLTAVPQRVSPNEREEIVLDRFSEPTGKQQGRIVMARDGRESLSSNMVVYIDLGTEDQIKSGDYFTIFRPVGTGNLTRVQNEEIVPNKDGGFESDRNRGGGYSNQPKRLKKPNGDSDVIFNRPLTTRQVIRHRPQMPRKIVGELVVLSVQGRTATAIITRNAQEILTGDWVELQ